MSTSLMPQKSSTASSSKQPLLAGGTEDDDLDALFQSALDGYKSQAAAAAKQSQQQHFGADQDVIKLDDGEGAAGGGQSRRKRQRAARVAAQQSWAGKQAQQAAEDGVGTPAVSLPSTAKKEPLGSSFDKGKAKAMDVDAYLERLESGEALEDLRRPRGRAAARQAQEQRAQTAGSKWFDLPAFPTDGDARPTAGLSGSNAKSRYVSSARGPTAEEMKREVQAIRLRNAMDPKRFYKGGTKDKGMPKFAQLGKIISSPLEPRSTLTRAEKGNTVVEELIKDAQAASYAKRKYGEHQVKASAGGKSHAKAKTRKPNDRKRQRK